MLSVLSCHLYHTRASPKHAAIHPTAGNIKSLLFCKVVVLRFPKSESGLQFKDFKGSRNCLVLPSAFWACINSRWGTPVSICSVTSDWVLALIPKQTAQTHGPAPTAALETIILKCSFSLKTARSLETAVSAEAPKCWWFVVVDGSIRYGEHWEADWVLESYSVSKTMFRDVHLLCHDHSWKRRLWSLKSTTWSFAWAVIGSFCAAALTYCQTFSCFSAVVI